MLFRLIVYISIMFFYLSGCKSKNIDDENKSEVVLKSLSETKGLNGSQLADIYCQSCHLKPKPELLNKAIWRDNVLPQMSFFLGIGEKNKGPMSQLDFKEIQAIYSSNIFPDEPQIAEKDWKLIVDYYLNNAPDIINHTQRDMIKQNLNDFRVIIPDFNTGKGMDVSMVKIDSKASHIFVADNTNTVNILDSNGKYLDSIGMRSPVVDMEISEKGESYFLSIGKINPSDLSKGELLFSKVVSGKEKAIPKSLVKDLKRPVDFAHEDLNQDGLKDLVIANYGHYTGSLHWYENKGQNFIEHAVVDKPGVIKNVIVDFNFDKLLDVVSMRAQGNEEIEIYYNLGNGKFKQKTILKFPPVYGSTYFDIVDYNKDGFLDILYVCGDNADFSFTLKEYHGIYLYINDGKNNFLEEFFYPLYGATKALAIDFDEDGDIDIACISFFADFFKNSDKGFVYLENIGNNKFSASTFKQSIKGRWLTMDAGDIDSDGDSDIVLGSYTFSPTPLPPFLLEKWRKESPYIIILKNQLKK